MNTAGAKLAANRSARENEPCCNVIQEKTMTGGGWSCPHEVDGSCSKINNLPCDPGMKGCELYGRYAFFDSSKNARFLEKSARAEQTAKRETPGED